MASVTVMNLEDRLEPSDLIRALTLQQPIRPLPEPSESGVPLFQTCAENTTELAQSTPRTFQNDNTDAIPEAALTDFPDLQYLFQPILQESQPESIDTAQESSQDEASPPTTPEDLLEASQGSSLEFVKPPEPTPETIQSTANFRSENTIKTPRITLLSLPTELQTSILLLLPFNTQLLASSVCPLWRSILSTPLLLYKTHYFNSPHSTQNTSIPRGVHRFLHSTDLNTTSRSNCFGCILKDGTIKTYRLGKKEDGADVTDDCHGEETTILHQDLDAHCGYLDDPLFSPLILEQEARSKAEAESKKNTASNQETPDSETPTDTYIPEDTLTTFVRDLKIEIFYSPHYPTKDWRCWHSVNEFCPSLTISDFKDITVRGLIHAITEKIDSQLLNKYECSKYGVPEGCGDIEGKELGVCVHVHDYNREMWVVNVNHRHWVG